MLGVAREVGEVGGQGGGLREAGCNRIKRLSWQQIRRDSSPWLVARLLLCARLLPLLFLLLLSLLCAKDTHVDPQRTGFLPQLFVHLILCAAIVLA